MESSTPHEESKKERLIRIFILAFLTFLYGISSYAGQLVGSKWLVPADFGVVRLLQSYYAIIKVVVGVGIPTSMIVMCGREVDEHPKNQILGYATRSQIYIALAFFALLVVGFFGKQLVQPGEHDLLFLFFFGTAVISASIQYLHAYTITEKNLLPFAFIMLLTVVLGLSVVVGGTYYYQFSGYLLAFIVSQFFLLLGYIFFLRKRFEKPTFFEKEKKKVKEFWHIAKYSILSNGLNILIVNLDTIILSFFINKKELGLYGFATLFFIFISFYDSVLSQYITPILAFQSKSKKVFLAHVKKFMMINALLSVVLLAGATGVIYLIVKFFFPAYIGAMGLIFILLCTWFVRSLFSMYSYAFLSYGSTELTAYNNVFILCFNVIFTATFAYLYGVYGAAFGQLLTNICGSVVLYLQFLRFRKNMPQDRVVPAQDEE